LPLFLTAAFAVAAVVGVAAWFSRIDTPAPAASSVATPTTIASAPSATTPEAPTTAAPSPTPSKSIPDADSAETRALIDLTGLRNDSLRQTNLDGSWVAQLSSKSVGITDASAVAANGTHRFLGADIFKEHLELRQDVRFASARVVLLKGTDFGQKSTFHGKTLWVTLAVGSFFDERSVKDFCQIAFPDKSGAALLNVCTARRLTPPH